MQSAIRTFLPVLLLIGCLDVCHTGNIGCALWFPSGQTDVCCHRCHPGNRQVTRCGLDPKELCEPCAEGSYITEPARFTCSRCTRCTAPQMVMEPCTSSRDTVCGCVEGYLCVDAQCSRCSKQCGRGEEPTAKLTCQACPNGTFNDQIHQKCIPWRTSCPLPGHRIVLLGTAVDNSVCSEVVEEAEDNGKATLAAVMACFSLGAIAAVATACVLACRMAGKRRGNATRNKREAEKPETEGPLWEEQQVDCSLCYPQQEKGGSLNSVSSQGSENKLLPV